MNKLFSHLIENKITTGMGAAGSGFILWDDIDDVHTWQGGVKLALKALFVLGLGGWAGTPGRKRRKSLREIPSRVLQDFR